MGETVLLILYIVLAAAMLALLVYAAMGKKRTRWIVLFSSEAVMILISFLLTIYYNNKPVGDVIFPGLEYFAECIFSMGAVIIYVSELLLSLICLAVIVVIRRKGRNNEQA